MRVGAGVGAGLLVLAAVHVHAAGAGRPAQGYLGVDVRDVTQDEVAPMKLKDTHGAEIVLVDHDAPAGKCGLREHDVVLMLNGQAVEGRDQFRRLLHEAAPGQTIVLVVTHDGQQKTVSTQMAVSQEAVEREAAEQRMTVAAPDDPSEAVTATATLPEDSRGGNSLLGPMVMNPSYTGLYLEKMSAQLAGFFGVPGGSGLLVRSVQENSPAAEAGMHAGDVVLRADGKPVATTNDWAKAIKNSQGKSLTVVVMREKREQTMTLTPDGKRRSSLDAVPAPEATPANEEAAPVAVAHAGLSWVPQS